MRIKLGVELGGVWCGGLLYADDIVLIAGSEEELQRMLNVVRLYAGEWKFRFNSKKSKGSGKVEVVWERIGGCG